MASCKIMAFIAVILVVLPMIAMGDDISPTLAPFYEKVCEEVECGKGTCKADISYPLNYICECEPGWKRTKDGDDDDDNVRFLPCVIPNCTLDYSCQPAPPPVPEKEVPHNISFFDPCYWIYCGEGTCNKTSNYKHVCQCKTGYQNLMNKTYFPCYSECTLGSDCASLGITVSNAETTTQPSANTGSTFLPGNLHWMAISMMAMAMVLYK